MKRAVLKLTILSSAAAGLLTLGGCAATQVAIEHRNLDVRTQMSSTIFLKPIPDAEHTIFVQLKNTSDQNIDVGEFTQELDNILVQKGYRLTSFEQAHYILQANILQIGKMDPSAAATALSAGFGGALAGGALAGANGSSGRGIAGAALAGGVVDFVADSMVKNVTYTAITDIQITENSDATGAPGVSRTRMLSSANQVNLAFKEALPKLESQIVHSISGIF